MDIVKALRFERTRQIRDPRWWPFPGNLGPAREIVRMDENNRMTDFPLLYLWKSDAFCV